MNNAFHALKRVIAATHIIELSAINEGLRAEDCTSIIFRAPGSYTY